MSYEVLPPYYEVPPTVPDDKQLVVSGSYAALVATDGLICNLRSYMVGPAAESGGSGCIYAGA